MVRRPDANRFSHEIMFVCIQYISIFQLYHTGIIDLSMFQRSLKLTYHFPDLMLHKTLTLNL
jgi:hypothetical protein